MNHLDSAKALNQSNALPQCNYIYHDDSPCLSKSLPGTYGKGRCVRHLGAPLAH